MSEKILIIDNEPQLVEILRRVVQNGLKKGTPLFKIQGGFPEKAGGSVPDDDPGPELLCFTDCREAIHWSQEQEPDVVIVDYLMPAMNGLEFIKRFREIPNKGEVPIVMLTGVQEQEIRYQALELGANDFISKPIDITEFILRIGNLLTLQRNRKKLASHASRLDDEIKKATCNILDREQEMIFRLSKAVEYREMETGAHIMRIAYYSQSIARGIGLSDKEQYLLLQTAPMHDIGKVGTPDRILQKTGNLNKEEYEIMKQHTIIGHKILQGSTSELLQTAAEIALTHHERYNGSGYPQGLYGEAIPLYGRIVALADVFDALTTRRGYKKAWGIEEAFEYIESKSGKHFDPLCTKAFLSQRDNILSIMQGYHDESHNPDI